MRGRHHRNHFFGTLLILLSLFGCSILASAADVDLAWDPCTSGSIAGYKLYIGTSSGHYNAPILVGNSTSYTVNGLPDGTWYFAVTAFDLSGNESDFSNEVFQIIGNTDTTPPAISGVNSSAITMTAATITWTTNETADTQVDYGTTAGYGYSSALDSSKVITHAQSLAGLIPNSLYHYRVKSRDAAGNLAVSSDYTFNTPSDPGSDLPVISNLGSSDVTSRSAKISWNTNKATDGQVDYGTTSNYESSTPLNSSMATSHVENLTDLKPSTTYRFRVKSRDSEGNLVTSGDRTFTTAAGSNAPVISNVTVSEITNRSARISWDTDKFCDSEVRYWLENGAASRSVLGTNVTRHSLMLYGLKKKQLYHFYVKSVDPDNNEATMPGFTFTTLATGNSVVAMPRFVEGLNQNAPGDNVLIGIALTNMSPYLASLNFTARDVNGDLIAGPGIHNPGMRQLGPETQSAILDISVFGEGFEDSNSEGWIKMVSPTSDAGGFFLTFDSDLSLMDGTSLGDTSQKDFIFTEIEAEGSTRIDIANNNPEDATVTFKLMRADGSIHDTQSRMIKANGALVADLYGELFREAAPESTDYVLMSSTLGVQSFEIMRKGTGDIATLTGQDLTTGGNVLYSPQYVIGGVWRTRLSVVNLDSRSGSAQFQFIGEDGTQIGATRVLPISARGKLLVDDPDFFQHLNPSETLSGYVKITSNDLRLAGSTVFGDRNEATFSSALPLIYDLQESVLFSHIASNNLYFTGLAIVNPGETDAYPVVEVRASGGLLIDSKEVRLRPRERKTGLLQEFFPSLAGKDQVSGYIRILSEKPLASFALFGTHGLSVLSAIPPQVIQ